MAQKQLNGRIALKHDLEVNWVAAAQRSNFTPNPGEVIIYDPDENHAQAKIKIGDGVRNVEELPFYSGSWNDLSDKPFYEINETNGEIKTLDSKFIGDDIARVSEVPSFEDLNTVSATAAAATNEVSERVDGLKTDVANISDLVGDTKVSDQISTAVEPIDTKVTNHETDVDAHSNMGWISSEDEVADSPTPIDADTLNGYDAAHFDDQIAVERERINSFVALGEGSTTGDAELADARIDKDGKTHENVGEHIRSVTSQFSKQIDDLKKQLEELRILIENGDIDFAIAVLDNAILDVATLA